MEILPIFYKANNTNKIIVVGGGEDASRKLRLIKRTKANITVISKNINEEIKNYITMGAINYINDTIKPKYLNNIDLIFGASDCDDENNKISQIARKHKIPVNIVDKQHLSDFIIGGIVERSPLVVSICSNGSAPILVRNIRAFIETILDNNLGKLCKFADSLRPLVNQKYSDSSKKRRRFWEQFFNGETAKQFLNGNKKSALDNTYKMLNHDNINTKQGKHIIIKITDNDSDKLTIADVKKLQQADVIVYPYNTCSNILELFRRDAIRYNSNRLIKNHINKGDIVCELVHNKQIKKPIAV